MATNDPFGLNILQSNHEKNFNSIPDAWYYEIYRKDLRKLINRFTMGLDNEADLSATIGILSIFFNSHEEILIQEARKYLKNVEILQKYFPDQRNFL